MRVRALDANGDMQFGGGSANFLVNSPAAVGQNIGTRLDLWKGEWFLDRTAGTPWTSDVLGRGSLAAKDLVIRKRILETAGVTALIDYSSSLTGRVFNVSGVVDTQYGAAATFDGSADSGGNPFILDQSLLDGPDVLQ